MAGPNATGPRDTSAGAHGPLGTIRPPAVAGSFYPADAAECSGLARHFVTTPAAPKSSALGAIVPHAGWVCSGAICGLSIAHLAAARPDVDVVVVFGAVHMPLALQTAALDSYAAWQEPGAAATVSGELRSSLLGHGGRFVVDDRFHQREHAVEVVLPMIQAAWPSAKLLAIETPPGALAVEIGRLTAKSVIAAGASAVYLASSDLTHYGPNYQFTPAGVGKEALAWAKGNDLRLLRLVTAMQPEAIVPEVMANRNACGPGAIAAMMAACLEHGAARAAVLAHASSFETLARVAPQRPDNAVGYAAVVIGT